MPVELNWANLRSINGSQQKGFEKFCGQLARQERVEDGSVFIPVGDPDAGVECYWLYPDGKEWGWQAKFFTTAPQDQQWNQVTRSVERALEGHPELKKYTICMPIDLPDARIRSKLSCREKWERNKTRWEETAQGKGMEVDFEFWGETEIIEKVSKQENRGRTCFWFSRDLIFSNIWLEGRVKEILKAVGPKYTRDLNIELPIAGLFDELGRSVRFYSKLRRYVIDIKKAFKGVNERIAGNIYPEEYVLIGEIVEQMKGWIEQVTESGANDIEWQKLLDLTTRITKPVSEAREKIENKPPQKNKRREVEDEQNYRYALSNILNLANKIWKFRIYIENGSGELANKKALLVTGTAGTGKTHLFCDIAESRVKEGLPTILLLGQHFTNEEPWSHIITRLGAVCESRDEFLGGLSAAAEASGQRALILIDALNEGEGTHLWNNHLSGFLETISRYPWISVALSVRTSYEPLVIPDGLVPGDLFPVEHHGFSGVEYKAVKEFFDFYNIELPSTPLLAPEFLNPLFLKLFCSGLQIKGMTRMPKGVKGIKAIFDFYVKAINDKLYKPEYLNYDKDSNLVQKAVENIAGIMAEKKQTWLTKEEAKDNVDKLHRRHEYENTLFRHLITENVINEDIMRSENGEYTPIIRFPYQRFSDHYITRYLLDKYLPTEDPGITFHGGGPLNYLVQDERACYYNQGLISALSVQVPEKISKEFHELVPKCIGFRPVKEAFIESFVWRDYGAFSDKTKEYINKYILTDSLQTERFLEALLTVSTEKEHPYNARRLHSFLNKFDMADRDSWWSIFLHRYYGEETAIDRIVDWAISKNAKSDIVESETVLLSGFALSWFLTSSNRFLRDRATKALVNIFENRILLLREFIAELLPVNDIYILERLFAVAYGCALRTIKYNDVKDLALNVYEWVFEKGPPPVHLLLRDYARGIIELALRLGFELDISLEKARPPYGSEWPENIPSEKELEVYGKKEDDTPDEFWAQVEIYDSVMGFGDFARYIIGTNSGYFNWFNIRLTEPKKCTHGEITRDFENSLTKRQLVSYKRFEKAIFNIETYKSLGDTERKEFFGRLFTEAELNAALALLKNRLINKLGKKKKAIFEEYVIPYVEDRRKWDRVHDFDLSLAQRFILKRVFDMGWSVEKFGSFDRNMKSLGYSRMGDQPERIGKKYQWIAFYEFLARVADNFVYRESGFGDEAGNYEGPWQINRRDIDPSCLIPKDKSVHYSPIPNSWWFQVKFEEWDSIEKEIAWLKKTDHLPDILPLIETVNPSDNSSWLALEGFYAWGARASTDGLVDRYPKREIWYMLKSYLVKKDDISTLYNWAQKQNFRGHRLPESRDLYEVFLSEFYRSVAYDYHCTPYYGYSEWTKNNHGNSVIPVDVLVTAERYLSESGTYDCSVEDTISILLPSKWLVENMGLRQNGIEGQLVDNLNELTTFDPSVFEEGPGVLLIKREKLFRFLEENGYSILWLVLGEKRVLHGGPSEDYTGMLEINGAYKLEDGSITGEYRAEFKPPPPK